MGISFLELVRGLIGSKIKLPRQILFQIIAHLTELEADICIKNGIQQFLPESVCQKTLQLLAANKYPKSKHDDG